jgi:integrase
MPEEAGASESASEINTGLPLLNHPGIIRQPLGRTGLAARLCSSYTVSHAQSHNFGPESLKIMKCRFILYRRKRGGMYYLEDTLTRKQESLGTRDRAEATSLLNARNESVRQPQLNLQIAKAYLSGTDSGVSTRTWQNALDAIVETKHGSTRDRWQRAAKDKALDLIRQRVIVETQAEHFLASLKAGTVSTNVHLRKLHNFCLAMNWLSWPLVPKRLWPEVRFQSKRAITLAEHQLIIGREKNPERCAFYELCWHLGGSQSDIANLKAEDIDWNNRTIAYLRQKTGSLAMIHFGPEIEAVLRRLPVSEFLFPYLQSVRCGDRATEFKQRCGGLGIKGVSLHSYRYAWAERAKVAGYPERFAQEALGHNSKAVHRAYAKKALVVLPTLEEYERKMGSGNSGEPGLATTAMAVAHN